MPVNIPVDRIQVFKIDDESFLELCNEYPSYRSWMLTRAKIRRCHWKKVFQENLNICLLQEKEKTQKSANLLIDPELNDIFDRNMSAEDS